MTQNRLARVYLWTTLATGAALAAGCASQTGDTFLFKPMRSLLKMPEPVRIGTTHLHVNPLVTPPWAGLQSDLQQKLGRQVQVLQFQPFQIHSQLEGGFLDFAILSATDYAEIRDTGCCQLVAQPVNTMGERGHRGLIIAKKDSKIEGLADLKGQRFAFGPSWDAASHLAAAYALMQAGLDPKDIVRELLPLPLARRHHLDSYEVAKAVAYEPLLPAGAIDEVEYHSWPDTGGSMLLQNVSQDSVRVIVKTAELPEGPIVASRKADPKLVGKIRDYLLSGKVPPAAIRPLHWQGFAPVEPQAYDQVANMLDSLRAKGWITEVRPQAPTTAPATPGAE